MSLFSLPFAPSNFMCGTLLKSRVLWQRVDTIVAEAILHYQRDAIQEMEAMKHSKENFCHLRFDFIFDDQVR